MFTADQSYEFALLTLCVWRECRGESSEAQHAVAWVVKNRLQRGGWFGMSWVQVILKPAQFSSFNPGDPNAVKFPHPENDSSYGSCLMAAKHVYEGTTPDPTGGALYYFDSSMEDHPPSWAKDFVSTVRIGRLHFFKDK